MQPEYIRRQRAHARLRLIKLRLIKDAEQLGNVSEACRPPPRANGHHSS